MLRQAQHEDSAVRFERFHLILSLSKDDRGTVLSIQGPPDYSFTIAFSIMRQASSASPQRTILTHLSGSRSL